MSDRWLVLATYNSEMARGIVHTAAWKRRMAAEQSAFYAEMKREVEAKGGSVIGGDDGGPTFAWTPGPQRWWERLFR